MRDNESNRNGVKGVWVRVRSDGVAPLSCHLFSYPALSNVFVAYDSNSTTSNDVTSLRLDVDVSTNVGTYSLGCTLPPRGAVYGYRVEEF